MPIWQARYRQYLDSGGLDILQKPVYPNMSKALMLSQKNRVLQMRSFVDETMLRHYGLPQSHFAKIPVLGVHVED